MKNSSEGICTDLISDSVDYPREGGTLAWVKLHCGSEVYCVVMLPSSAPYLGSFVAELPRWAQSEEEYPILQLGDV
jgi:hypothetical protein